MKTELFLMPSHPPERDTLEAHNWDQDVLLLAEELGYTEAWIPDLGNIYYHYELPEETMEGIDHPYNTARESFLPADVFAGPVRVA